MSRFRWTIAALAMALISAISAAQEKPNVVTQGKAATALLLTGEGSGTAFCFDESGLFATNYHAVRRLKIGDEVKLVLRASEVDEKSYQAKLIRFDAQNDLAVLRAVDKEKFVSMNLGQSGDLMETQRLVAFGFPFGEQLAFANKTNPSVSVNAGSVTSLRKVAGKLEAIQVDVVLNPGNSGGPVIQRSGDVVGIVRSGILGAGINFVIPVEKLKDLLAAPEVDFSPPKITRDAMGAAMLFKARPVWLRKSNELPVKMQLEINALGQPLQKLDMPTSANGYEISAVPVPSAAGAQKVRLHVEFDGGSMQGETADKSFQIGPETVWLRDINSLVMGPTPAVNLREPARQLSGPLRGLEIIQVNVGPVEYPVNVVKIKQLRVEPPRQRVDNVTVTVIATHEGKEVARRSFRINLDGEVIEANAVAGAPMRPPFGQPSVPTQAGGPNRFPRNSPPPPTTTVIPVAPEVRSPINAPTLTGDVTVRELPSTINDIAVGGGGRYLVLQLGQLRKLAIFDVNEGRVTNYVPLGEDNVRFAAGNSKLIVVSCDSRIIQRWDLATANRELTTPLPVDGVVKQISMGSASGGPLLVHWAVGTDALARAQFDLIDIQSLKNHSLAAQGAGHKGTSYRDQLQLRASANGRVFGMWELAVSPSGLQVLILGDSTATKFYEHDSVGHVAPSADGRFIFTGSGIYTQELRRLDKPDRAASPAFPAHGGGFFLRANAPESFADRNKPQSTTLSVYMESDLGQPIVTIPNLDVTAPNSYGWASGAMPLDKRVHLIPDAKLLVTIPGTNDRLVLQPFDVEESLNKLGVDYLFITSNPANSVKAGSRFEYPMTVKSKKGSVKFKLDSGPEGMSVSETGVVTWDVPSPPPSPTVSVILCVQDAAGQERFHSFTLKIEG